MNLINKLFVVPASMLRILTPTSNAMGDQINASVIFMVSPDSRSVKRVFKIRCRRAGEEGSGEGCGDLHDHVKCLTFF